MAKIIEEVAPTEKTYTVELTQSELDFVLAAATALGEQGYVLAREPDASYTHGLASAFKPVAKTLVEALDKKRANSSVFI